jgi:hypothetical protein
MTLYSRKRKTSDEMAFFALLFGITLLFLEFLTWIIVGEIFGI